MPPVPSTAPVPSTTLDPFIPSTTRDPFKGRDKELLRLVEARADWHAPDRLLVDEPAAIGLSIGESATLREEISTILSGSSITSAGKVKVSPDVSVALVAAPAMATVVPAGTLNASTGSDIALLWVWQVHPLRPTSSLRLDVTLTMTIPETTHKTTQHLHLILSVERTASFTAQQVFTWWGTWLSILMTVAAGSGWLLRRRRRGRHRTPVGDA